MINKPFCCTRLPVKNKLGKAVGVYYHSDCSLRVLEGGHDQHHDEKAEDPTTRVRPSDDCLGTTILSNGIA